MTIENDISDEESLTIPQDHTGRQSGFPPHLKQCDPVITHGQNAVPYLTAPALCNVKHGFFTRQGGVSIGDYSSLNCTPTTGDDPANVDRNRHTAMRALSQLPTSLRTLRQVHSASVISLTADNANIDTYNIEADALVTNCPDITLGITTADCAPILFTDPKNHVIGAAHAGWRGTQANIMEKTVAAMEKLGANRSNIIAIIGPCIAQASYEVGEEFLSSFDPAFFLPSSENENKYLFNLRAAIAARLSNIALVKAMPSDTYSEKERFFSCRRNQHDNRKSFGCQISLITLSDIVTGK